MFEVLLCDPESACGDVLRLTAFGTDDGKAAGCGSYGDLPSLRSLLLMLSMSRKAGHTSALWLVVSVCVMGSPMCSPV